MRIDIQITSFGYWTYIERNHETPIYPLKNFFCETTVKFPSMVAQFIPKSKILTKLSRNHISSTSPFIPCSSFHSKVKPL